MCKYVKPMVSAVLVAVVVASALFCCCVGKIAQAATLKNAAVQACCPEGRPSDHKDDEPCTCGSLSAAPADIVKLSSAYAPVFAGAWYFHQDANSLGHTLRLVLLTTVHGGPSPGQPSSVPLYLQFRSIRI